MTIPTGTIDVYPTSLNAARGATVYFTNFLSNVEADYINGLIQVEHGTLTGFYSELGGYRWSAYLQPTSELEDSTNTITYNYGSETVISSNYAIDTVVPTLTSITWSDDDLGAGESAVLTVTFSEAMTSGPVADLEIARLHGINLSEFISSDGGVTWTATLTPPDRVDETLSLPLQLYTQDLAGNQLNDVSETPEIHIDTKGPTWTVSLSDTDLRPGETAEVTFTFSEAVTGFTKEDVIFPGGTLSDLTSSDGGVTWIAIFTPDANTASQENLIGLRGSGVTDLHGNAAVSQFRWESDYSIDTRQPTATITLSDTDLKAGEAAEVTITFSHTVHGFDVDDLTVENGTLSLHDFEFLDGLPLQSLTGTFTPSEDITDASNVISLNLAGVSIYRGNTGTGSATSDNFAIDTERPTATIAMADTTLGSGQSTGVTFTFSEAVTGFANGDVSVQNGTLSTVTSADGGVTWTATFTADNGVTDGSNVITLDMTDIDDLAGNSGTGQAVSQNYEIRLNVAPHDVALSGSTVAENAARRTVVGTLVASDDADNTHTYTLLDDAGGRFALDGDKLVVADSLGLDFEINPTLGVTVRATDQGGLTYDKTLTIRVSDVVGERVTGDARANVINGGEGEDRLYGGAGKDLLIGAADGDFLFGGDGEDILSGGGSNDMINGGGDADVLEGGAGNDAYWITAGDRVIEGANTGSADVAISAEVSLGLAGLGGGHVEHAVLTGSLDLALRGNAASNLLTGNDGDNRIAGGLGSDVLTGGAGADRFVFDTQLSASNVDAIKDFSRTDDIILLDKGVFTALGAAGGLRPGYFKAGAAADSNDHILYDGASGALFYDADGNGTGAAVKFAVLATKPAVDASDFMVM